MTSAQLKFFTAGGRAPQNRHWDQALKGPGLEGLGSRMGEGLLADVVSALEAYSAFPLPPFSPFPPPSPCL